MTSSGCVQGTHDACSSTTYQHEIPARRTTQDVPFKSSLLTTQALLETSITTRVAAVGRAVEAPPVQTAAARLLLLLAPHPQPKGGQPCLLLAQVPGLLVAMVGPTRPPACRAAAALTLEALARHGDACREAVVQEGAAAVLVQGVAGGGDMGVKTACARALAQLARLEQCKVQT